MRKHTHKPPAGPFGATAKGAHHPQGMAGGKSVCQKVKAKKGKK